ncbi:hypothetical protein KEM54_001014, partial [Ascosphaera aggregata]
MIRARMYLDKVEYYGHANGYFYRLMSHLGFNSAFMESSVPTTSGGSLLTRLPPILMVMAAAGEMAPVRLPAAEGARIEPVSSNPA